VGLACAVVCQARSVSKPWSGIPGVLGGQGVWHSWVSSRAVCLTVQEFGSPVGSSGQRFTQDSETLRPTGPQASV
jgi:hypothetical protein